MIWCENKHTHDMYVPPTPTPQAAAVSLIVVPIDGDGMQDLSRHQAVAEADKTSEARRNTQRDDFERHVAESSEQLQVGRSVGATTFSRMALGIVIFLARTLLRVGAFIGSQPPPHQRTPRAKRPTPCQCMALSTVVSRMGARATRVIVLVPAPRLQRNNPSIHQTSVHSLGHSFPPVVRRTISPGPSRRGATGCARAPSGACPAYGGEGPGTRTAASVGGHERGSRQRSHGGRRGVKAGPHRTTLHHVALQRSASQDSALQRSALPRHGEPRAESNTLLSSCCC